MLIDGPFFLIIIPCTDYMSATTPFRSHLLQQWARNQKRPPVAVVPWLKPQQESDESEHRHHGSSGRAPPSLSTLDSASFTSWKSSSPEYSPDSSVRSKKTISSIASGALTDIYVEDETRPSMSAALQSLLVDRRRATLLSRNMESREAEQAFVKQALCRAVECAQMAPNHKGTEPFSFRRFMASSPTAGRLAEISYQVALADTKKIAIAEAKRGKWLGFSAFLVTLVHENQISIDASSTTPPYKPLPYVPPGSETQLEDVSFALIIVVNIRASFGFGIISNPSTPHHLQVRICLCSNPKRAFEFAC